jgi:PGF-CTERM protein
MFDERGSTFTTIAVAVAVFAAVAVPAAALGSTVSPTTETTGDATAADVTTTTTPNNTSTATATATPNNTSTATTTATPNNTSTATTTATPNNTSTATATATPNTTSTPTDTPEPTATPRTGTATITFTDQQGETTVTVDSVSLSEGGFVVIYNSSGIVIGTSDYLEPGDYESLNVSVSPAFTMSEVVIAEVHYDNGDQSFNATEDVAYESGGTAVSDTAFVSPDGFSRTMDTATATPTATETTTVTEPGTTDTPTAGTTETGTPGFTVVLALLAVVGAVALGIRTR